MIRDAKSAPPPTPAVMMRMVLPGNSWLYPLPAWMIVMPAQIAAQK